MCKLWFAEALIATIVLTLASLIAVAYLWARVAPLSPFALLGFTIATAIVFGRMLAQTAIFDIGSLAGAFAVTLLICGWLLRLAWPSLVLTGGGPDLAHHLQLLDYVERHWRLPDATMIDVMGEMAHYTPGLHLVAALVGAWTGSVGFHAIYAIVAMAVALKCALVFLIAWRLTPEAPARVPVALGAALIALLPQAYFAGAFLHDSFLAQVFAELFAVAMWWSAVVWDQRSTNLAAAAFALFGVAVFLTWPIWIGPPIVAFTALALTCSEIPLRTRVRQIGLALAPIAIVAVIHASGRMGWIGMARTSGAVLHPSIAAFGWPFVVCAAAGLVAGVFERRARFTMLFVLATAVQAATLYAVARSAGASTPYMAFKMFYLLIYPLAALGALAIARLPLAVAATALIAITIVSLRPLTTTKLAPPIVSEDLYEAGRWARGHLEAACVDYLVPYADTAYWLHLAVLGNPRSATRAADPDTFEPDRTVARWIQPQGLPYAIVQLSTLPREVLSDVDILEQFGSAAVVKRRGPSTCAEAQRLAGATP